MGRSWENPADGDFWDVFVPGFQNPLPKHKLYRVSTVLGVIMLPNGNHKIVVELGGTRPYRKKIVRDVSNFIDQYAHLYKLRGVYIPL